jgi:hypothetical protein
MGCDIHTFIEYADADFTDQDGEPYWSCFGGQINQGRNYTLFGLLAGVRGGEALFKVRGLPEGKLSYQAKDYMTINIDDEMAKSGAEGYASLASAKSWGGTIEYLNNGKPYRTENPDLHSHSWLTRDELQFVLAYYRLGERAAKINVVHEDRTAVMQAVAALQGGEQYDSTWDATLAAMNTFEERGAQTRLIFCFDN